MLHATTAAYPGLSVRLQVHGDRGSAIIDDDQLEYFGTADTDGNRAADLVPASDLRGGDRGPDQFVIGHFRQYDDIVEAIREHRAPGVTVADAFLSLAAPEVAGGAPRRRPPAARFPSRPSRRARWSRRPCATTPRLPTAPRSMAVWPACRRVPSCSDRPAKVVLTLPSGTDGDALSISPSSSAWTRPRASSRPA